MAGKGNQQATKATQKAPEEMQKNLGEVYRLVSGLG